MNILPLLLIAFSCVTAHAADNWKLSSVLANDKPVGYIYHTSSMGTQTNPPSKSYSGLRLICSLKGGEPAVALYWKNGMNLREDTRVTVTADNRAATPTTWGSDSDLLFRNISESRDLLTLIKTSKTIKFQWMVGPSSQYTTAFNVSGIDLSDFNAKCKTEL